MSVEIDSIQHYSGPQVAGRTVRTARSTNAISHHYDVGNDFYRLVLGESMTYSCGYWAHQNEDLGAAQ